MGDTNYFSGTVKILEKPLQSFNKNKLIKLVFRVEISQTRQNKIVSAIFWGNLANEIKNYYQINDYILIEGYTSIKMKNSKRKNKKSGKLILTVLKVYPILLNSNPQIKND